MSQKANYFKLGLFVIGAIAAGVIVLTIIGTGRFLQKRITIETYFNESVQGLDIGSKMKYRGVEVGQVTRISFTYVKYEQDRPMADRKRYVLVEAQIQPRLVGGRAAGDIASPESTAMEVEKGLRVKLAPQGAFVVFGITPSSPHTGYGYIKQCAPKGDAFVVDRFVEKPDLGTAQRFLAEGGYFWNSGIFVFRADRYLAELERHRPDVVKQVKLAMAAAQRDVDFVRPERDAFLAVPDDSIDRAVMERTRDAAVVPARFGWSDVGSWSALWTLGVKDELGNVSQGDVLARDSHGSYLRSEGRLIAAVGVENLVIIETSDALLVSTRERADDVKLAVEELKRSRRTEHAIHRRVYRPWGYYESIDAGERFQVKRLMVKPGARLSLQRHRRRAEHWVVVSGEAKVTRGDEELRLTANQSTYIPTGAKHRLENPGTEPLFVIEVQSGDYFGEDDIERFADDYHRT